MASNLNFEVRNSSVFSSRLTSSDPEEFASVLRDHGVWDGEVVVREIKDSYDGVGKTTTIIAKMSVGTWRMIFMSIAPTEEKRTSYVPLWRDNDVRLHEVSDDKVVLQVFDGLYLGPSGITPYVAEATNLRGPKGNAGQDGIAGTSGETSPPQL